MRKIYFTALLVITSLSLFAQTAVNQASGLTNPLNAHQLQVHDDLVFEQLYISPGNNFILPEPADLRDYYNQNYYFTFTFPQSADVDLFLKYPAKNGLTCTFATYSTNSHSPEFIDMTRITESPGIFKIRGNEFEPGETVLVRFWFSQQISNKTIEIALQKTNSLNQPKLITVDQSTYTPTQLVLDVLISGCLQASNVTYTGDPISIGYFSGAIGTSGFNEGIVLTSGDAAIAEGPDASTSEGHMSSGGSDPDLQAINPGFTINDAAVLEFDFIPASDTLRFEYIFGSEEFPEFANSSFNDAFGFFLSGPGINGPYSNNSVNIALLPNGQPVTIDNIFNSGVYYVGPTTGSGATGQAYNNDIEYDGASVPLTAEYQVQQCQNYHIKLAIGDAGDSSYDSGVFFKAGSFTSGQQYVVNAFNPWFQTNDVYESCETIIVFTRTDTSTINDDIDIPLDITGTATMGNDFSMVPDTFTIASGMMSDTLTIQAFADGVVEGTEEIIFTYADGCPCNSSTQSYIIEIHDQLNPVYNLQNNGPICLGDTAVLDFILQPGMDTTLIDFQWLFNGSTDSTTTDVPGATTTYSLEVIYPCFIDTIQTTVTVVPPPVVNLGPNQTVAGLSTNLNVTPSGGNTGYWSVIGGPGNALIADTLDPNSNVTVDTSGTYVFTWTEISLAPDCLDIDTIEIEFLHIPNADFTVSPIDCYGDTIIVTYVGNAYPWANFDWNFDGATVLSGNGIGPYEIVYDLSGPHTIQLEVEELGVFADTSITFNVPEEILYTLTVNDDPCYQSCNGNAQIDVTGGTGQISYSWPSGIYQYNNLCAGNYSITVTDENGCTAGEDFIVEEPTEMVYTSSFEEVECYGDNTGMAMINPNGSVPPYTYVWSNGNNLSQLTNLYAGQYSVTVYDDHGCSVTESFNITQPPFLGINFNQNTAICEGQQVNLQITGTGGVQPYTYYWNEGSGFSSGSQSQVLSPTESTNYTVYIEDANGCNSAYRNMELTVSPTMIINLTTQDNSCYNSCDGSAYIEMTGGLPPFDYSWPAQQGSFYQNICSGLYDVTVTDQIGCNTDTVFFIDQPDSIRYDMFSSPASCAGVEDGSAWIDNISGGTTPYTYMWTSGSTEDITAGGQGLYSLTLTDAKNCHSIAEIEIDAPETIDVFPGNDKTICISNSATITADAMGGTMPYNFIWMGEDSTSGNDHIMTVSPDETTVYYVTVTDANGCTGGGEVTVNVRPPLSIDYIYPNKDTVCRGKPVTVQVFATGGDGGPYTMTLMDENEIVPSPFEFRPQESQWWHLRIDDNCGTPPAFDSVYINVFNIPSSNFIPDKEEGCPPLGIQFNPVNPDFTLTYNWFFGDNDVSFYQNPYHIYNESGNFDVTLTVMDRNGCTSSTTLSRLIEVYPKPNAVFYTTPDYKTELNSSVGFISQTENADSLFWYFGDGDSSIWNIQRPHHIYDGTGEYEAILVAKNYYGCTDTSVQTVRINEHPTLYVPEAFTPNGDGHNDCFGICGKNIDPNDFYFSVYNRWGEKVFETNIYNPESNCKSCGEGKWDGTYNGARIEGDPYLPGGQYMWYLKYRDPYGNMTEEDGTVILVR